MSIVTEVFAAHSIFPILNEKSCSEVNVYIDKDTVTFLTNNFFCRSKRKLKESYQKTATLKYPLLSRVQMTSQKCWLSWAHRRTWRPRNQNDEKEPSSVSQEIPPWWGDLIVQSQSTSKRTKMINTFSVQRSGLWEAMKAPLQILQMSTILETGKFQEGKFRLATILRIQM